MNRKTIEDVASYRRPTLKIAKLRDDVQLPVRKHLGDAGLDLYIPDKFADIPIHNNFKIPLGIAVAVPNGTCGVVIARSSIATRGISFAMSPIDYGYTGEIHAIIHLQDNKPVVFGKGERIAQLVILPCLTSHNSHVEFVDWLNVTDGGRGNNGFGSTGK